MGPLAARKVSVRVCVCVVTNIVGQHTLAHTHTHRDTPRLCCNFSFFVHRPLLLLLLLSTLPALVIIVFAFFSFFFVALFLPFPSLSLSLCLHTLPSCCWLSSLVRNVIKFLLVQQHSTLFSSLLQLPLPQLLLFPLTSLAFGLRYLPPPAAPCLACPVHFTRLNTNCAQRGMFTVVKRWTHCDSLSSRTAAR